ncbi:MAG TPA: hypothetical protein VKX17_18365 [Planctomycetota bacterium]|nr:hypothetical protein [Planctomycetota bacterium]
MAVTKSMTKKKAARATSVPNNGALSLVESRAELRRLARKQRVKPYTKNAFRKQYPSLSEPGTWDGFEEFVRALRQRDKEDDTKRK